MKRMAPGLLSEEAIRGFLTAGGAGRVLEIHDCLDSTNNRAKALAAAGAPHGLTVIADSQTGGRGRRGRSFFSPGHTGVYMTCVLRPECPAEKAGLLTSLAAVATARAVEKTASADIKIKWVNDLYLNGKKICGILSEAGPVTGNGKPDYAVMGIGVNAGRMDFPPELRDIATSIGNETGRDPDRNRLIAEILNGLDELWGDLETGAFLEESRRRSNVIGRTVTVIESGRSYPARALDIDGQGRLVIETGEGRACLNSGEVSLKIPSTGTESRETGL
jgi:BirA family biotin operon repressor/biotin-[acetyl-CoA-carboxylase] ligase